MDTDLQIILEFLARCGAEVEGRADLPPPNTEQAARLLDFARGDLTGPERAELCGLMKLNQHWLRWIADRVVASRTIVESKARDLGAHGAS